MQQVLFEQELKAEQTYTFTNTEFLQKRKIKGGKKKADFLRNIHSPIMNFNKHYFLNLFHNHSSSSSSTKW